MLTTWWLERIFLLDKHKEQSVEKIGARAFDLTVSVHSSPVQRTFTRTIINFSKTNVRDELRESFNKLFSADELALWVNRFADLDTAHVKLWVKVVAGNNPAQARIVFSKKQSLGAELFPMKFRRSKNVWEFQGVIHVNLRKQMSRVATEFGWEHATFTDRNGRPSTYPFFTVSLEQDALVVSAEIRGMSEEEFGTLYKLKKRG